VSDHENKALDAIVAEAQRLGMYDLPPEKTVAEMVLSTELAYLRACEWEADARRSHMLAVQGFYNYDPRYTHAVCMAEANRLCEAINATDAARAAWDAERGTK
jgi:hypothetical protein